MSTRGSAALALFFLATTVAAARQANPGAKQTVWDGVYSDVQAQRGQQTYRRVCSKCHLADLSGGENTGGADGEVPPPLAGPAFTERWTGQPVSELFLSMKRGMPLDAPGSLKPEAYADVASYVLKMNQIPAGSLDLPADTDALEKILISLRP